MNSLVGEAATLEFAAKFAQLCQPPLIIYLQGDLGSGKTTFARGFINKLGYSGKVKSPTFTLVESYDLEQARLYHFDLYRLKDPLELEYIGIRDLTWESDVMCLIEWPERGGSELPEADLVIRLEYQGDSRAVDYQANSTKGQMIIDKL
ncbi:MAG: tRNA (adenosine(37)-N6)-threonylcarbamoyltransferase complex ATPase subunit type 1 TsaE [Gammaproteobacteria bacterium]|nr:tRNA (adenosine(37)-N6)-threonylcarbamoyltransferase complex ATPase subunit type 1 TsaE [Gammaproteobacteria bacterium]